MKKQLKKEAKRTGKRNTSMGSEASIAQPMALGTSVTPAVEPLYEPPSQLHLIGIVRKNTDGSAEGTASQFSSERVFIGADDTLSTTPIPRAIAAAILSMGLAAGKGTYEFFKHSERWDAGTLAVSVDSESADATDWKAKGKQKALPHAQGPFEFLVLSAPHAAQRLKDMKRLRLRRSLGIEYTAAALTRLAPSTVYFPTSLAYPNVFPDKCLQPDCPVSPKSGWRILLPADVPLSRIFVPDDKEAVLPVMKPYRGVYINTEKTAWSVPGKFFNQYDLNWAVRWFDLPEEVRNFILGRNAVMKTDEDGYWFEFADGKPMRTGEGVRTKWSEDHGGA